MRNAGLLASIFFSSAGLVPGSDPSTLQGYMCHLLWPRYSSIFPYLVLEGSTWKVVPNSRVIWFCGLESCRENSIPIILARLPGDWFVSCPLISVLLGGSWGDKRVMGASS